MHCLAASSLTILSDKSKISSALLWPLGEIASNEITLFALRECQFQKISCPQAKHFEDNIKDEFEAGPYFSTKVNSILIHCKIMQNHVYYCMIALVFFRNQYF